VEPDIFSVRLIDLHRTTSFRLAMLFLLLFGAATLLLCGFLYWQTKGFCHVSRHLQRIARPDLLYYPVCMMPIAMRGRAGEGDGVGGLLERIGCYVAIDRPIQVAPAAMDLGVVLAAYQL
jgi:hypothetical protein